MAQTAIRIPQTLGACTMPCEDSASYMLMSCAMSGTTLVRARSSMVEARCMSGTRSTSPRHQNHLQNHSNQG
jgi:hypothetical protein